VHVGLLICGSLDTITGGFIYDRYLVQYLREHGDRVEVIALPWRPYLRSLSDNLNRGLEGRLRQTPFDVLIQDELAHPSCFWLNRRLRPQIAYLIVALVHHLRCREQRPVLQNRIYELVEQSYLNSVDAFICVSRTTQKDVENLVGASRPLAVATPGKDGLPGSITPGEIMTRAAVSGPLQIIFVGNLIPRKELHTLLTALAQLSGDCWRLTVAGSQELDKAYAQAIRRQIDELDLASRITLLGTLPAGELAAQCAASHVLAVPSSYEGFGIIYIEGMHFGLPAIASTAGAAREIITPGENGFLVDPGDAHGLAQCLKTLITDRRRLVEMSLAAHRRAAAHPTWNESAARIRTFLKDLLG
jgi:glycosyltransferase involved in cell wall biosynthesis